MSVAPAPGSTLSDSELADHIYSEGRDLLEKGEAPSLEAYMRSFPSLPRQPISLDAAISICLRGMVVRGKDLDGAVESLVAAHPQQQQAIEEAGVLERVLTPTVIQSAFFPGSNRALPMDFGPLMSNGSPRYILLKPLGKGGFGDVYLAADRHMGDEAFNPMVAVKIGRKSLYSVPQRAAIAREAAKARRVEHPGVVRVLDRGITDDQEEYIVSEYVEGGTLAEWRPKPAGIKAWRQVAELGCRIADALHAVHSRGIVHCDLTPRNVLLDSEGNPKITDFGVSLAAGDPAEALAKSWYPGLEARQFVAPERLSVCSASVADPLSDIYSFGVLLCYLLLRSEQTPIDLTSVQRGEKSFAELAFSIPAPDVLFRVVRRCLASPSTERYQSALSVRDDLRSILELRPVPWCQGSLPKRAGLWLRRNPIVATVSAMALVATVAAGYGEWSRLVEQGKREKSASKAFQTIQDDLARLSTDGVSTRYLLELWSLDWLNGKGFIVDPGTGEYVWARRLEAVRGMISQAEGAGRSDDVQTWQLRLALAMWQIEDAKWNPGTSDLLGAARQHLAVKLGESDSLTQLAGTLLLCSQVKDFCQTELSSSDPARLARASQLLGNVRERSSGLVLTDAERPVQHLLKRAQDNLLKQLSSAGASPRES